MRFAALVLSVVLLAAVPAPAGAEPDLRVEHPRVGAAPSVPDGAVVEDEVKRVKPRAVVRYRVDRIGGGPGRMRTFRRHVATTLNDHRGWSAGGRIAFRAVRSDPDFTIWLADPDVIAGLGVGCSWYYSCRVGDDVYINAMRWREGADSYRRRPLSEYRSHVVNHEVGHWLGLGHRDCLVVGGRVPAAVMQQQSKGLDGCRPNAWPLPREQRRALSLFDQR